MLSLFLHLKYMCVLSNCWFLIVYKTNLYNLYIVVLKQVFLLLPWKLFCILEHDYFILVISGMKVKEITQFIILSAFFIFSSTGFQKKKSQGIVIISHRLCGRRPHAKTNVGHNFEMS